MISIAARLAVAIPVFPDPIAPLSALTGPWGAAIQNLTWNLYLTLLLLELIVFAAQAAIFKDSIEEYFRAFAGKVFVAIGFGYLIVNANLLAPSVVKVFQDSACRAIATTPSVAQPQCSGATSAAATTASCTSGQRYQCLPNPGPNPDLVATFMLWGTIYFMAADVSQIADDAEDVAVGTTWGTPIPPDPGNGEPGSAKAFLRGHKQFQLLCMALGLVCFTAAIGIWLTYMLLYFELYIVLAIGVITMAFGANRLTKSFSRGFLTYVVNVGTGFFAYYFVCAALSGLLGAIDSQAPMTILGLVAGAAIPLGIGSAVLVFLTSPAPIIAVVSAVCVYAVPQFARSLLKGQSALSSGAMWKQFNTSLQQSNRKLSRAGGEARAKRKEARDVREEQRGTGAERRAGTTVQPQPSPSGDNPPARSIKDMSPTELGSMNREQFRESAKDTTWSELSPDRRDAIAGNHGLRNDALDHFASRGDAAAAKKADAARETRETKVQAQVDRLERAEDRAESAGDALQKAQEGAAAASLSAFGKAAPQGEQQMHGIQVQMSNPDRPS